MPGTKGIVTIGTMSESMEPPTVRPNPGPKKDKAMAKRFAKIISKRRVIGVGGRKPKRGSGRTRKAGR